MKTNYKLKIAANYYPTLTQEEENDLEGTSSVEEAT